MGQTICYNQVSFAHPIQPNISKHDILSRKEPDQLRGPINAVAAGLILAVLALDRVSINPVRRPLAHVDRSAAPGSGAILFSRKISTMHINDMPDTHQKPAAALVVGGGIGGMRSALDLADAGLKVY